MPLPQRSGSAEVIGKIEIVFGRIVDSLLHEEEISISLLYKKKAPASPGPSLQPGAETPTVRSHSFPGRNPQEAWRFGT